MSSLSVDFDGGTQHALTSGDPAALKFERTDTFSIFYWIRPTVLTTTNVLGKWDTAAQRGYAINHESTGRIEVLISNGAANRIRKSSTVPYVSGKATAAWMFGGFTYDGSSSESGLLLYVNGYAVVADIEDDTLSATIDNIINFQVSGLNGTAGTEFFGNVDEVTIHNVELTAAEVTDLYNAGAPTEPRLLSTAQSLVGYWTMGDGDTFPNLRDRQVATPAANTGASIKDRSANSNNGTPTNMEAADFRAAILASETMPDLSGSGNAGTPTNMEDADFTTDTPGGVSGYSATFDGVNEHVSLGNVHAFDRTSPFSLSIWVKTTHVAGNHFALAKANAGAPEGYHILVGSTGVVVFGLINTFSGNDMRVTTTTTVNDGSWHHIVATWDGDVSGGASGAHIYIDGVDETLVVQADTLVSTIVSTADLRIGTRELGFPAESWNGQLDEVSIYDKELSQTEVQAIYNSGVPVDNRTLSTAPNLVGYWGCGDAGPGGVLRQVANLDGVDEYVTLGNVATLDFERTSTFTWTFWFKTTATSGYLVSKQENAVPTGWAIGLTGSGGLFFEMIYNFGLGDRFRIDTDNAYNDDTWHHGAVSFSGNGSTSGATFYIDGAAVAATSVIDALGNNIANNAAVQFGDRELDQGTTPFAGQLAAFTAHDKVLSLTEVQALYNSGRSTDPTLLNTEPNLVGMWLMNEVNDLTMTNMASGDIESNAPLAIAVVDHNIPDFEDTVLVGGAGGLQLSFKMRGRDDGRTPGDDYITWIATGEPDFAGAGFATGDPTPIGSLIAGSVVKVAELTGQ